MIYRGVSYRKELLDHAKKHKKFLVTIDVYGKHFGDQSCCVQTSVSLPVAKRLAKQVFSILKSRGVKVTRPTPYTGKE